MRILVAHNVSGARNGGMSRLMGFVHDEIIKAGHAVDYLCTEDLPAGLRGRLARFAFPILVYRYAVAAARSGKPYDIINVHEPCAAAISLFKARAGHPAVVVTSHGVERRGWELALEEQRLGRGGPSLKTRVVYPLTSLWQSRIGLRHADHVFCLNSEDLDYLVKVFDVAEDRITRIGPGVAPIFAAAAGQRSYREVHRLLFAGSWLKRKGIQDLISAFEVLVARHPELRLTILGAGVPEAAVRMDFPGPVRANVSCVHASSEKATAQVFAASDLFLFPSLFEGTPLTLIEAMASGLPIVTTATCGMKDVIEDGRTGLLIPTRSPAAAIAAVDGLIADAALRARLGKAAQEEALTRYTWGQAAMRVLTAYEQIHRPRSRAPHASNS
ncbi:MAG: glycosyltransferase family 4 protein [Vicinamibacterales bacterium]|nr:glycosyltransferase family 4 protein [Vicinamibacterales bacterium]